MTITQTVEIPADRRITLEVPPQIPTRTVTVTFTPAKEPKVEEQRKASNGEPPQGRRGFGCAKGQIWMADDFDAPLEDFKDYM
jgi:hypothetical protein